MNAKEQSIKYLNGILRIIRAGNSPDATEQDRELARQLLSGTYEETDAILNVIIEKIEAEE